MPPIYKKVQFLLSQIHITSTSYMTSSTRMSCACVGSFSNF